MFFFISLLLMVWVSLRWASRLASTPADGYWIFVASLMLQVGAITSLTSLVHQLTPAGWLLVQGLLCALSLRFTGGWRRPTRQGVEQAVRRLRSGLAAFVGGLSVWGLLLLCVIGAVVLLAMVRQGMEPLRNSDDWLYHATRVIHWIQNRSVFPYSAHIIQQNIVPFGSELFFLWPVLLTKSELVGRLVFGLALPLATVGQYLLLRALRLGQTAALAGVLVLVSTPLVLSSAMGLKPEIWAILTLLGLAHWAVTVGAAPGPIRCFFLGVFAVLSINVRSFPVVLLPSLVLIVWWASGEVSRVRRLKFLAAGGLCGGLLSALLIPLVFNTVNHGHPMGPELAQQAVKAQIEPQVMYTHAVRFAFQTLELPVVPVSEEARAGFSRAANQAMAALGAGEPLLGEKDQSWPGLFAYTLPEQAARYSLWGLLWMPVLLVALVRLVRNLVSTWPRVRLTDVSVLALLAIPLWAAILFGARWMVHSDVPGRFLVGAYALALTLGIAVLAPRLSGSRVARALAALAVVYASFQPIRSLVQNVWQPASGAATGVVLSEPFSEVTRSVLPSGSRVLLVGDRDSREYPLFSPETHYANTVIPWGNGRFDPVRMRRIMDTERVTHVLIHNDQRASFLWSPALDTREFVRWLNEDANLRDIPLRSPGQRLYEVKGSPMNELPLAHTEVPAALPLVRVAPPLMNQVGIDPAMWQTPWPVEDHGGQERGFLWLGQGAAEGIEFALWSRQDRDVDLRLDVVPGPGLTTSDRRFLLLHDGLPVGRERTFEGAASVVVRTRLHAGRNLINLLALDSATVNPLPSGDARNLVLGLSDIRVEPAQAGIAEDPQVRTPDGELARRAGLAVGLIHRRQQADGYWLTSHTTGTRFEQPVKEMNTYVTALMVDVLGSKADNVGLAGSLALARNHLQQQIESSGLVRYHGKPGGRAMKENGMCTITPDTDDTALVWRLAPGADSLRPAALETLRRYRTAEGLYQTWLAPQSGYSCLNPGADPNPPDVGIQMHLLMWLAQVDPPAARALCTALRNTIDQERLWVYYRKAPLVPVMRQTDLKAVGCDLQLPPTRVQTDIPEQHIWLDAARMLVALEGGGDQVPSQAQVRPLLQALSDDGFSAVRQNPPMLYHNDLSASVSRLYWSEDVGYAIWLRLYLNSAGRQP